MESSLEREAIDLGDVRRSSIMEAGSASASECCGCAGRGRAGRQSKALHVHVDVFLVRATIICWRCGLFRCGKAGGKKKKVDD